MRKPMMLRLRASADGGVRLWPTDFTPEVDHAGAAPETGGFSFDADSTRVLTTALDGTVGLLDVSSGSRRAVATHAGPPLATFLADGESVASTSDQLLTARSDDSVWLGAPTDGGPRRIGAQSAPVNIVFPVTCARQLGAAAIDGSTELWEPNGRAVARLQDGATIIMAVASRLTTPLLATASADGAIRLWNTHEGTPLRVGVHDGKAIGLAFSPDGRWFASSGRDGRIQVWNIARHALPPGARPERRAWLLQRTDENAPDAWRL